MDTNTIIIATAIAGGLYILLTILEKLLIAKKSKEVKTNDNGTSNGTDTTDNFTKQLSRIHNGFFAFLGYSGLVPLCI